MTLPLLGELLEDRWADWFPGHRRLPLRLGFLASSRVDPPRGVVMVFEPAAPGPAAVVKVALSGEGVPALRNEFGALEALWPHRARIGVTLPRPLEFVESDDGGYAVLSGVAGRLLPSVDLGRHPGAWAARSTLRHLTEAVRVGAALRDVPLGAGAPNPIVWSDRLRALTGAFELTGRDRRLVEELAAEVGDAALTSLPHWQHGDLAVGNLLVAGAAVSVVDWEKASPRYPGWFDPIYAVLTLPFSGGGAVTPEQIAAVFDTRGRVGAVVQSFLMSRWQDETLPLRTAAALTAAEAALTSQSLGRSGAQGWVGLLLALLGDAGVAASVGWLDPRARTGRTA